MSQKGFTLIELMVAMVIIAIISTVGIYAGSTVLKVNRNTQRTSDLKLIQVALQQYYTDQGFYPCNTTIDCLNRLDLSAGGRITNCTGRPVGTCDVKSIYLSTVPVDPGQAADSTAAYCYEAQVSRDNADHSCNNSTTGTKCQYYHLYAVMEPEAGPLKNCQNGSTTIARSYFMVEPL